MFGLYIAMIRTRPLTRCLRSRNLLKETPPFFRLVGRINAPLDELSKLFADANPGVNLDLGEVTLVDLDVIRFLGNQELLGTQLANCSRYIREWIQREQTTESSKAGADVRQNEAPN